MLEIFIYLYLCYALILQLKKKMFYASKIEILTGGVVVDFE